MEKQKNNQLFMIAALSLVVLFMTVGFALYESSLTVHGTTTVNPATWSVHYITNTYAESTNSVAATSKTITNTDVTYSVTLDKPGDFYEFTIDVINDGSFDAKLTALTMTALSAAQQKYLTYTVTYNGVDYTASQSNLNIALPCTTGSNTKTMKVRVAYVQPENSTDLPTSSVDVTLNASLDYVQD